MSCHHIFSVCMLCFGKGSHACVVFSFTVGVCLNKGLVSEDYRTNSV